jgi:hypothetical protein
MYGLTRLCHYVSPDYATLQISHKSRCIVNGRIHVKLWSETLVLFIVFTADRHLCFLGLHMRIQLCLVGKMHWNALLENAFCPPGTAENDEYC